MSDIWSYITYICLQLNNISDSLSTCSLIHVWLYIRCLIIHNLSIHNIVWFYLILYDLSIHMSDHISDVWSLYIDCLFAVECLIIYLMFNTSGDVWLYISCLCLKLTLDHTSDVWSFTAYKQCIYSWICLPFTYVLQMSHHISSLWRLMCSDELCILAWCDGVVMCCRSVVLCVKASDHTVQELKCECCEEH